MKAVILAGGLGTRLAEETTTRPKPMVEIGGKPILWHIMKIYSHHGINDFIICCGYKGYMIKEYFANYFLHTADITVNLKDNTFVTHQGNAEDWRVTLVDTGEQSMTGGRLKRVRRYLDGENSFCLTYGDGVSDVNISESIQFHIAHGKLATMTVTSPRSRFGHVQLQGSTVCDFQEKPDGGNTWLNIGFFVLSPDVIDYIDSDDTPWEQAPLKNLAACGQLQAFCHEGFWQPMDTLPEKNKLEELWASKQAPWKVWE